MYADQVVAGSKRSIKDRLNGGSDVDFGRTRSTANGKRQRQNDDKWKHDLYEDDRAKPSKLKVGAQDLRLKLDRKMHQQSFESIRTSGFRDLREKLSGTMHAQPINSDPPNPRQTKPEEVARPVKKNVQSTETPAAGTKKVSNPATSRKKSQKKDESTVHNLLQSLGLDKYSITFQAEEVDMDALMHMNDDDLKALGIPMGPRKKILLALDSHAKQ